MAAFTAAAAITAGSAVYAAKSAKSAANKAANATTQAADASIAEQQRQFDLSRQDTAAWRTSGEGALNALNKLYGLPSTDGTQGGSDQYGGFTASPGYQFRLDQGTKAVQNSAAARGRLFSGATQKAVNDYAQNTASGEFQNYVGNLQSMAGLGQSSANQSASNAIATGQSIGQTMQYAGAQNASTYQNAAANQNSAIQSGIGNLAYLYGQYKK